MTVSICGRQGPRTVLEAVIVLSGCFCWWNSGEHIAPLFLGIDHLKSFLYWLIPATCSALFASFSLAVLARGS